MLEVNNIYQGNSLDLLRQLEDNSIDSIVTDPPYELGFMNKGWDKTGIAYNIELWKECLRVLKHGGHLLAFGGTRTYHRMACAIEDAGFEIRDQIQWIYGSGFPKSYNISKAITKSKNDREKAKQWDGWGTALKPANEPIVLARKSLSEKTIVNNVLEWGAGGINIDECRVEGTYDNVGRSIRTEDWKDGTQVADKKAGMKTRADSNPLGRYPANVILDEEAGKILDEQSGLLKSGTNAVRRKEGFFLEHGGLGKAGDVQITYGDSGGTSRFFYCAKASKSEKGRFNTHPTVKPIKLMEYLVRLVTPKNGVVLDPFAGSGTTLLAAKNENFNYIGLELNHEYIEIANKRLDNLKMQNN